MKQKYMVLVLFVLLVASFFTSIRSYKFTENYVSEDMEQALALTLAEQQSDVVSQDTIRIFNRHLQTTALRGRATIDVGVMDNGRIKIGGRCSAATIFSLSDQRLAAVFWSAAMMWAMFCFYIHVRRRFRTVPVAVSEGCNRYGGLAFSDADSRFTVESGEPLRLTPMQQQLLEMFFRAPSHRLTKQEICDTLWPKKPDASDTLYTLVRRLRPILEQHSHLFIESDRGKAYQLGVKNQEF